MGFLTILAVAVGLAMDAFAVSIAAGICLGCVTGRQSFRLAFFFGFFQFLMPLLGWGAGYAVGGHIQAFDHWIAMGLLTVIGGKMIHEALKPQDERCYTSDPTRGMLLLGLSIATSIDAFVVGLSLGILHEGIWYPSIVIGLVAAAFTVVGLELGCRIGTYLNRRMEILGGVILIAIGIKIVVEHVWL